MKSFVRHIVVPHHTNNYRSKALHIDALLIYAVLLVVFHFSLRFLHTSIPSVLGYATNITIEHLLTETNARRSQQSLAPLQLDPKLSYAATLKAQHMFEHNYWAHTGPDGVTPWDFIIQAGYEYSYAGENLAKNFMTSPEVVDAWIASRTHKDNIMKSNYTSVGFGIVNGVLLGEEVTLVVQMFGTPLHATDTSPSAAALTDATSTIPQQNIAGSTDAEANKVLDVDEKSFATTPVVTNIHEDDPYSALGVLQSITKTPKYDVRSIQKYATYVFFGFLVIVLLIDAWVVIRKRHVRVAGHNISHLLFLGALLLFLSNIPFGSIL